MAETRNTEELKNSATDELLSQFKVDINVNNNNNNNNNNKHVWSAMFQNIVNKQSL